MAALYEFLWGMGPGESYLSLPYATFRQVRDKGVCEFGVSNVSLTLKIKSDPSKLEAL